MIMFLCICQFLTLFGFVVTIPQTEKRLSIGTVPDVTTKDAVGTNTVCSVNGTDYRPGDTWTDRSNICTTYKCLGNGQHKTINTGCMYKGVCKDRSTPWTEDCFTFQCVEGTNSFSYMLTSAGCNQTDGQCLPVGQRRVQGCDVIECQIQDRMVVNKIVNPGCSTDTGCMEVGEFRHDGCSVYTCTLEGEQSKVHPLPNDRMRWPDGQFALMKPKSGCPDDNEYLWSEGSRKHYGSGNNSFSSPLSLAGIYTREYFKHEFCVRQLKTASSRGYKTRWQAGSYCIFRSRSRCPKDFAKGFIIVDDSNQNASRRRGALPDGDYRLNTGFYFCCRNDGPTTTGIELPNENPFVLLQNSKSGCQAITGMTWRKETITFSGGAGPGHFKNGKLPYIQTDKTDVTLGLCYYEGYNGCGCVDESGEIIDMDTERMIGCVVKRCSSIHGRKVIEILEGGCLLNDICVPERDRQSNFNGQTCNIMSCIRITSGTDVKFQMSDTIEGCVHGMECIAEGDERTSDCVTSRCEMNNTSGMPMLRPARTACPWDGTCKTANSTWQSKCTTYRCDVTSQSGQFIWNIVPLDYGCEDGSGKCYKIGENVTDKCYDAICRMAPNKTVVYLDVIKGGCRWRDGCKLVNETWSDDCHDYRCEWIYTDRGFTSVVNATQVSCKWNGTCYKQDTIWSDGCIDYKCAVTRRRSEVRWKVDAHQIACTGFNGKCVPAGQNITDNCITYECVHGENRLGLEPVAAGCKINDVCVAENQIHIHLESCVDYICQRVTRGLGTVMQLSPAAYKCAFNNTCMDENATWEDGCRTRKCVIFRTEKSVQRSTAAVKAGCDDEGICRAVGYTKMTKNCMEYKCEFKKEYRDAFFTLVGGACKSKEGHCKPVNTTWREMTSDVCVTYHCEKDVLEYVSKVGEQMCKDSNGNCQPVGSVGFSARYRGILRYNCECRSSTPPTKGVSIYCNP